ncbi:cytochrome b/b6 domain-containing protein [Bradyrhizobium sp. UFLA05-153]
MRLGFVQKSAVWTATAVVTLSGVAWFVLHDLIDAEPSETERLLLMLHGVSAYAVLIVIGSLLPLHVRSGWYRRRKRWTGGTTLAMLVLLAMTGLALYYGGEATREPARWLHIAIGIACIALFPVHALLAATVRRSADSAISSQKDAGETESRCASAITGRR